MRRDELLIESKFIQELMDSTTAVENDFVVTAGSVVKSFFDFLLQHKQIKRIEGIDFGSFDDIDKLNHVKQLLEEKHRTCRHKYKKLHYLYVISRVMDRIYELQYAFGLAVPAQQKLEYIIQPADITLVEYASQKLTLDEVGAEITSGALKYFSHSIFSHVGLIGHKNPSTGFDRLQSTAHTYHKRSGAWKLPFAKYLQRIGPCELLVTRYQDISIDDEDKIIEKGMEFFEAKAKYDTGDALADITGFNLLRSDDKMNCGEFVYDCLKVIDSSLSPKGRAIPETYAQNKKLQQVYLTRIV